MNVLWITNILFPEAEQLLTGSGELKASGGWMLGAANALLQNKEVKLTVASVSAKVCKLTKLKGHNILYYVFPMGKGNLRYNEEYFTYWTQIQESIKPDVVHIHVIVMYAQKKCALKIADYLTTVCKPIASVCSCMVLFGMAVCLFFETGLFRLILTFVLTTMGLLVGMYFFGMNNTEKQILLDIKKRLISRI